MQRIKVINKSNPSMNPVNAVFRSDFWGKLAGLMFRKNLQNQDSLILDQGTDGKINSSIHMLFMKFDIAAIWVNSDMIVVDVLYAKKWQLAYIPKQPARYVLETHIDYINQFIPGDEVEFLYE